MSSDRFSPRAGSVGEPSSWRARRNTRGGVLAPGGDHLVGGVLEPRPQSAGQAGIEARPGGGVPPQKKFKAGLVSLGFMQAGMMGSMMLVWRQFYAAYSAAQNTEMDSALMLFGALGLMATGSWSPENP